jgi:hypothetical protein
MLRFLLSLVVASSALGATRIEEMIASEFVAKDAATACKLAEDSCYVSAPKWMKEGKALVGRVLSLIRAPSSFSGSKVIGGEVVWIVVIENRATSDIVATPWSVVCVRASDGSVTCLLPSEKKG